MAFYVIQRIHHVWKSAEIGQMMVEFIPVSDMGSHIDCPVQLPTHGWEPLRLWQTCLQSGGVYGESLLSGFPVLFPRSSHPLFFPWKLSEQIHGSSVSPGVGEDDGAQGGQRRISLERQGLMWAYVFVPTIQGMHIPSLVNCFKISSQVTDSVCQA